MIIDDCRITMREIIDVFSILIGLYGALLPKFEFESCETKTCSKIEFRTLHRSYNKVVCYIHRVLRLHRHRAS